MFVVGVPGSTGGRDARRRARRMQETDAQMLAKDDVSQLRDIPSDFNVPVPIDYHLPIYFIYILLKFPL